MAEVAEAASSNRQESSESEDCAEPDPELDVDSGSSASSASNHAGGSAAGSAAGLDEKNMVKQSASLAGSPADNKEIDAEMGASKSGSSHESDERDEPLSPTSPANSRCG